MVLFLGHCPYDRHAVTMDSTFINDYLPPAHFYQKTATQTLCLLTTMERKNLLLNMG